jgi:pimeloyl-ACP methyl ester carboxylesterase
MTARTFAATALAYLVVGCAAVSPGQQSSRPLVFPTFEEPQPAPAKSGFLDIGRARLLYSDTGGKGEPVVLLHPATGSIRSWSYQQPALAAAGYRVLTYSRRGHAGSEIEAGTNGGVAADDLKKLLDHLQMERAHLVGVAAGGIYSTDFALAHPGRVRSLTIVGSLVAVNDPQHMKQSSLLRPKQFETLPSEFKELGPQYRATNPKGVARWIELEQENTISPATTAQMRPALLSQMTVQALSTLRVPVLLMTGDADLYTPPPMLARLAQNISGAQTQVIEGSGHSPHWERPDAFNATLLGFLKSLRPS